MSLPPWIDNPFGDRGDNYRVNPLDEFRFDDDNERQYFDDIEFPDRNEMREERDDDWIQWMEMEMERARRDIPLRFKLFRTNLRSNHWF